MASTPPPAPSVEAESDAATMKKRSRRTLKIPNDNVPTPGPSATTPAPVAASAPEPAEEPVIRPMRIIQIQSDLPPLDSTPPPPAEPPPPAPKPAEAKPATSPPDDDDDDPLAKTIERAPREELKPPPPETVSADESIPTIVKPKADLEWEEPAEDAEEIEPERPSLPEVTSREPRIAPPVPPPRTAPPAPISSPTAALPPPSGVSTAVPISTPPAPKPVSPTPPPTQVSVQEAPDTGGEDVLVDADEEAPVSSPKKPPPPPPRKSGPASGANPETVQAPRIKPWWEEIFADDYIRTLDEIEPHVVTHDVDFIEQSLGVEPGAIILDLACGEGDHAVELTRRGYKVVGYDLSLAMLARAAENAQDRGQKLNFLQGDMREMGFEDMFDGIYSWQTSFGYFEEEKNVDVLRRMHRALKSGGVLLLDIVNRDYVAPRQPSMVWYEGDGCVCMDEMKVDFLSSRLRVKRTVMFEDGRSREIDYSIRLYSLHELGRILHDVGFRVIEVTGHTAHRGVFFGSESPRLIVLAERD